MVSKTLKKEDKLEDKKTLLGFYKNTEPQFPNPEILEALKPMLNEESEVLSKAAKDREYSQEFLEDHCEIILSKLFSELDKNAITYDKDAYTKFIVEKTLDFFNFVRMNEVFNDIVFESVAKDPKAKVYIDGKQLLPPGPHKRGYSVGVVSKREEEK